LYEKTSFSSGFNFRFRDIARNFGWALVFFAIAAVVLGGYQLGVVVPLTQRVLTASAGPAQASIPSLDERVIQYVYVVYEGIIEVLIFIGFLFDRLAKRWGLWAALIAANVAFALWHYDYWRDGWFHGTLMVFLSFLVGVITSLNYFKTKNSLSPIFCHTLIDAPNAIRELLGIM
jgi:membrane protease YdiL (CAAX protease family)